MHNLKNITVTFPRNKFIVVTGVSGSGKSSLTMDTLFAEGQRRYAESLSAYARQFLVRMDKPDVEHISGICPAIAIEQKVTTKSPRSTVGSMTEILDYLRLLYARIGTTYSPISGKAVQKDDVSTVVDHIKKLPTGNKILILAAFHTRNERSEEEELALLMHRGFTRLYIDTGHTYSTSNIWNIETILNEENTSQLKQIKSKQKGDTYILIDRIIAKDDWSEDDLHRIADSVQTAFYETEGACNVYSFDDKSYKNQPFNNKFERDGITFEEPSPNFFSFNNPYGACPNCEGFGQTLGVDLDLVVADKRLSVFEDAVLCWKGEKMGTWKNRFIKEEGAKGFPIHKAVEMLPPEDWNTLKSWIFKFFKMVESNLYKVQYRVLQARYRGRTECPECEGSRLRKDALYVKINQTHIGTLSQMPIRELQVWLEKLQLNAHKKAIAKRLLLEIKLRVNTMMDVGLGYLNLGRPASTLSGGESQRIQLTKFLGSNLTDSMYILDEPSIGLHPRDTDNLIRVLKHLQALNNTVIVVEHDDIIMRACDHIIDVGPLASHLGGEVVATGSASAIMKNSKSLTGQYLSGARTIPQYERKHQKSPYAITISGCSQNNLKNITVSFPLHQLIVVTGVSGSGKTTLVKQTLYPALLRHYQLGNDKPGAFQELSGDLDQIAGVELVDQNPIGKSSRSNPATYIKAYDDIRTLFGNQPAAKLNGFKAKHFSFNVDGGRCNTCQGEGTIIVSMQFLADVHLICDSCKGKRFKDEILDICYQGKNIYDVLEMSVDEALSFFKKEKKLLSKLQTLADVGLGYIKLGQSSNTLSGGEAQRVKLASYLGKRTKSRQLFIFDEPTTGLHFHDISKLLQAFYALIDMGHSIVVIEHNMDVVRNADHLIDIGPEGGAAGGELLFSGTPNDLKKVKRSHTAQYL